MVHSMVIVCKLEIIHERKQISVDSKIMSALEIAVVASMGMHIRYNMWVIVDMSNLKMTIPHRYITYL